MVPGAKPPQRGEVHLVRLDPTLGSEIRKTRPCLIVYLMNRTSTCARP
jgi:mRNA-degrading endonuclease toxin of MazEF toxin-antitoxin module